MINQYLSIHSRLRIFTRPLFFFSVFSLLLTLPAFAENNEKQIQAAIIYQFTKFIEWPTSGDQFVITVVGDDDLFNQLKKTAEGKTFKDRPILIQTASLGTSGDFPSDILVFGKTDKEILTERLKKLKKKECLTVTYQGGLAERGSVINFYLADDRLKFEVSQKAAERASLKLSSHLLKLARIVD